MISVLIGRSVRVWQQTLRWQIDPIWHESNLVTLLARLDGENRSFVDFHVLPNIDHPRRFTTLPDDAWLDRGYPLTNLGEFCQIVAAIRAEQIGSPLDSSNR